MDRSEFDKFADEYRQMHKSNIRASGEDPEFFARYKIDDLSQATQRIGLGSRLNILDFGSGIGNSLPFMRNNFPESEITALDVSKKSLDVARERFGDIADYIHFDGLTIPHRDEQFDVAFTACVFHHIPADEHVHMLREIHRTLKPGGLFMIFEHNPYNPLTLQAVRSCVFDENAVLINARTLKDRLSQAGFDSGKLSYRIFFPGPLSFLRRLEPFLQWLPIGAQYSLAAVKT